ncbi:MAG TPA: 2-phospho-L-lactate guanylyltransferase [Gaiellaceae bacterium]|jgi:2-phospho-L-lactate guanylyltransferase|nr:2-phospho-L-lactate guanylyltransferase [Gaiellaceae bacterium]
MPRIVVPFAGVEGKTRLHASLPDRRELSLAMLGDVVAACVAVGRTVVVTGDAGAAALALGTGAEAVDDPGGGQGAAVQAVLAGFETGPVLVVNADLPCIEPDDVRALVMHVPVAALALVEAADGTTNALSLPGPDAFAPLYGPGSAARFRAHAAEQGLVVLSLAIPNLADDVDTLEDLHRLAVRCGPRTTACLARLRVEALR